MNFFESIDPILNQWVSENKLNLFTEDRGDPIRAVLLGLENGRYSHEINIDYDNDSSIKVVVSYLDRPNAQLKENQTFFYCTKDSLRTKLDKALELTKLFL